MAAGMLADMAQTPTQPAGSVTEPPATLPTHAEGEALFNAVLARLQNDCGWTRLRVDTLVRVDADPTDRAQWTIRHQFDHGWELHRERMRLWNPPVPGAGRKTIIRLDRPLPTVAAVISELLGPRHGEFTAPPAS